MLLADHLQSRVFLQGKREKEDRLLALHRAPGTSHARGPRNTCLERSALAAREDWAC